MGRKKDTCNYVLVVGAEPVYYGITNNPKRREKEHRKNGKKFTKMLCY